jgi:Transposase DDE domain
MKEWKQRYAIRAGVEGTIHQAVAVTGVRRCRYIGLPKTRLAHILAATALNLIRLAAWWTGPALRRPHTSHLARLDLGLAGIAELGNRVVHEPVPWSREQVTASGRVPAPQPRWRRWRHHSRRGR